MEIIKQKHHITPRCILKHKDKSFVDRSENIVELSWEEHVKAHQWLAMLTGEQGCWVAYNMMKTGQLYFYGKGKDNPMFGKSVWNGRKHSEESKAKISASKIGKPGWNKGKLRSQNTKDKISKSRLKADYSGENSYWYGKKRPFKPRLKMMWCICGFWFRSLDEASKKINISRSVIHRMVKNKEQLCYSIKVNKNVTN